MTLREEALEDCYRRLERPLYNVLYRLLWQAQDCQDVIHDACMRVWAQRKGVDEATLDALLWTTAQPGEEPATLARCVALRAVGRGGRLGARRRRE